MTVPDDAAPTTGYGDETLPVIRAPKTAELIAERLRGQIIRQELRLGSRLPPEADLMARFGVSRPTLREAFRILESESLLSVRRGARGGALVVSPDLSVAARHVGMLLQVAGTTIGEVYEVRMAIEPAAARLLAQRARRADIVALRGMVDQLRGMLDRKADPVEWTRASSAFHDSVVARTGNRALAVQAAVLREVSATHVAVAVSRSYNRTESPAAMRKAVRSYAKLIDLIEAHDADGAEKHWRTHMQIAGKVMFGAEAETGAVLDLFERPARS
jgi:GntR family transcriptional regulator, transcriptional repressor for pyruvate dehydrogenase complex